MYLYISVCAGTVAVTATVGPAPGPGHLAEGTSLGQSLVHVIHTLYLFLTGGAIVRTGTGTATEAEVATREGL